MNFEPEDYFAGSRDRENENENWFYLDIIDVEGNSIDFGQVDFSESIDSITQKYKKKCGIPENCKVVLTYLGKIILGRRETLAKELEDINSRSNLGEIGGMKFTLCTIVRLTGGGYSVGFIDVEEAKITKLNFGEGPKYTEVTRGLNFFGKCTNRYCEAKD